MATQDAILAAIEHLPLTPEETRALRSAVALGIPIVQQQRLPNDIWTAAMRVVAYWQKRLELFGDHFAFLPLEQYFAPPEQRSEAMDRARMETQLVYQTGFMVTVPPDSAGRRIMWFDQSRIGSETGKDVNSWEGLTNHILRCFFYYWDTNQSSGSIVVVSWMDAKFAVQEQPHSEQALDMIEKCFYLSFDAVHVCVVLPTGSQGAREAIIPTFLLRYRPVTLPIHLHFDDAEGLRTLLQAQGISLDSIPQSAGGRWSYETFKATLQRSRPDASQVYSNHDTKPYASAAVRSQVIPDSSRHSDFGPTPSRSAVSRADGPSVMVVPVNHISAAQDVFSGAVHPASLILDGGPFLETTMMQQEGIRQLEEAMEMLATEDKAAYLAAMRQVPHLVTLESNPVRFLRFAKYNAWSAARHLATYWTKRLQIFGERAFLPFMLSGDGALNQEDIDQIKSGYFAFLPVDAQGRTVIFYDPAKRQNNTFQSRMRVGFYYWNLICENDLSNSDGFVALVMLGRGRFNPLDTTIRDAVDMVLDSFPTLPKSFHIVNSPSGLGQRIFYDILLPLAVKFMGRLINERTAIHVGEPNELIVKLSQYGLSQQNLPDYIGGSWVADNHNRWIRDRMELECSRYGAYVPLRNFVSVARSSLTSQPNVQLSQSDSAGPRLDDSQIRLQYADAMKQAIEAIPSASKFAYTTAVQRVPDIVEKESNIVYFLRHARFDVNAAAALLVKYWASRTEIFADRAYLPLQQTGEGALDRKDIAIIGSGYLLCLPLDGNGRSVIFCDGSRLSKSSRQSRLRTSFYMYSIALENAVTLTEGLVLLYVLTEASFDRANQECLQLVVDSLPLSIYDVHLLQHRDSTEDTTSTHKIDQNLLRYLQVATTNKVYHHSAPTKTGLTQHLSRHGFSPSMLPKTIGGKYGFDNFVQWQELRTRFEWDLPAGVSKKDEEAYFDFSHVKRLSELSNEEKNERKRKLNVIHSRRKRERERIEVEVLEEQFIELTEEKSTLLLEEKRLNDLIQKARACLP